MREAGLEVREDAVRNLIGRRGDGPVLMLGSHLDTVVDAGRYDGPLGVLVALEAVERRARRGCSRRGASGSRTRRACASAPRTSARPRSPGRFDPAWLELRDDDGVAARATCVRRRAGGSRPPRPTTCSATSRSTSSRARCSSGSSEPVGVVTAIAGQSHAEVTFAGEAGHAGTVPMDARRDALAAAAEWILAVERARRRRLGRGRPSRAECAQRDPGARDRDARPAPSRRRDAARGGRRPARARAGCARRDVGVEWRDARRRPAPSRWTSASARAFGVDDARCPAAPATTRR